MCMCVCFFGKGEEVEIGERGIRGFILGLVRKLIMIRGVLSDIGFYI